MITGYRMGLEVEWQDDEDLESGIIEDVFYETRKIMLDCQFVLIRVTPDAPTYLIRDSSGEAVVKQHKDLTLSEVSRPM